jgi:cytochrome c oxidase assembly protein subunit 11
MSFEGSRRSRRLGWKLAAGAAAMFGFGYLLVPLYQVYCQITGLNNGATGRATLASVQSGPVDPARRVVVEFVASTSGSLPWDFRPDVARIEVAPGRPVLATFHARNLSGASIIGQAVPSVTPNAAAAYFHKIECFCFSHQPLAPGESKDLPVQFVIDAQLPAEIGTLTLAYTFFSVPGLIAVGNRPATAQRRKTGEG